MNIKTLHLGALNANCYIAETADGQCVAVDIGGTPKMVIEYLKMNNLKLTKILLTHGHFDHIDGVEAVRRATGAEVYIHENDVKKLSSEDASLRASMYFLSSDPFMPIEKYTVIHDGDEIQDGGYTFRVLHTPGHTEGSVCYITDGVIFSGDTLFCCSVGRTDFPDGSVEKMIQSIKKLYAIDGDYKILAGHNESSTLEYEKQNNPYMIKYGEKND
ncbi:MAG: MBL fold metallo-hydrolase [Ruminococcus flavefaciens]|nr:MBL fold metallo-hydrolase [Ruminococcus flavefaciens]MCM1230299.1 MBL fold metallo-hydrolase [Ruminococcus flavefaciens]